MSINAAKEFMVELIDDEEATARADQAYLDTLQQIATEMGFETSADEIRDALREIKHAERLDDRDMEVSGFALYTGRDSFYSMQSTFEPLGFLR